MSWKGIVGRALKHEELHSYLHSVKMGAWRPKFVVVHNTSAPTLAQYQQWQRRSPPVTMERWLQNLQGYYRDQQGWSAGPHFFVGPDKIGVFTPINTSGVHTPSWNNISLGIETVGEYERETFVDPVKSNLVALLGELHLLFGWDPAAYQLGVRGLHFHKEDVRTTHKTCPGRSMNKLQLVQSVKDYMADVSGPQVVGAPQLDHLPTQPPIPPAIQPPTAANPVAAWMGWVIQDEGDVLVVKATEPGGAVKWGVGLSDLQQYNVAKGIGSPTIDDLRAMTRDQAAGIFYFLYYKNARCGELRRGVDYAIFDSSVVDGIGGATRIAQRALGEDVDGVFGPKTRDALNAGSSKDIINKFSDARVAYQKTKPGADAHLKGWTNRIERVRQRALSMAVD